MTTPTPDPGRTPDGADPQVAHLRAAIRRLRRREVVLRHRLDVTRWKLAKLEARRSTRLVQAVGAALRSPRALALLPLSVLRILRDRPELPPRPVESDAVTAAEAALEATPPPRKPPRPAGAPPPRQKPQLTPPTLVEAPFPDGPVTLPDLRVVTILDEFSARAFAYEASLHQLRPESWRQTLDEVEPHLLLVESAWRGVEDSWRHHLTPPTPPSDALQELVAECRRRGIPAVFWNKEDPPNFDLFIDSAALFDVVFTVDEGSVERYRERLGHDRIHVLPFAAQPRLHHPLLTTGDRDQAVGFAGTYYVDKHPHRKVQMMQVLEPARAFDLHIYARFGNTSRAYRFPSPLDEHVVGRLSYGQTLDAYRRYQVFLNVNSAPKSATMCARRIFELLACGATVVSGVSPAIEGLLGPGLVAETADPDRTTELLADLLGDDEGRARRSALGTRAVLGAHTYRDRFRRILAAAGLDGGDAAQPRLSVVVPPLDPASVADVLHDLEQQRRRPDEVLLIGATDAVLERARRAVGDGVRTAPSDATDAVHAARAASGEVVALLDPTSRYGPGYLLDQELALRYPDVGAVGKGAHQRIDRATGRPSTVGADREHRRTPTVEPGSLVARRSALEVAPDVRTATELVQHLGATGQLISTSRFEFVRADGSDRPVVEPPDDVWL